MIGVSIVDTDDFVEINYLGVEVKDSEGKFDELYTDGSNLKYGICY